MPDTWTELRGRYRLGNDPFEPHDNILAGTAYLREIAPSLARASMYWVSTTPAWRAKSWHERGRDFKRVFEDVTALEAIGLVERDGDVLRADYDEIRALILLDDAPAA